MVAAAHDLLAVLDDDGRKRISFAVDAVEWQTWANPEFMQFDTGLRLDLQPVEVREKALALMRASLSPEGYELAHAMMLINGFLGEVVDLETVLNEFSYNIALYGEPDLRAPWGWQLFGHHCAVNCLVVEGRMVVSPGVPRRRARRDRRRAARRPAPTSSPTGSTSAPQLMAALPEDQRRAAIVYEQMVDPAMPPGRVHPGDERHLAGAFQDNRVIPFEGVRVADMPAEAQQTALAIAEAFVRLLPEGPRAARHAGDRGAPRRDLVLLDRRLRSPGDVFYYRLQSPVLIAELDHHCGVFLDYDTPQPFHIHTVLRTPHGNDYGRAWVRQWQERNAHLRTVRTAAGRRRTGVVVRRSPAARCRRRGACPAVG